MTFNQQVLALLCKIPKGKVTTYKHVAIALKNPNAARAVGNACNKSPGMPKMPCHRVVKSDGSIGGYAKGSREKVRLLRQEGIRVKNNKVLEFNKRLFKF